ncbi:MAG: hypothetical protein SNG35_00935 [Rikenellaceae bacterium]
MNISIPLKKDAKSGYLNRSDKIQSIDNFIELLIATPKGSCLCDPDFGYLFANLRFEIINEFEELVNIGQSTVDQFGEMSIYDKKISGESKSHNTFASELKSSIEMYEKRIQDVSVAMKYVRRRRCIDISITATIIEGKKPYKLNTKINIWN